MSANPVSAEEFRLQTITVEGAAVHPSQQNRTEVDKAFAGTRSASEVSGAVLQNLNPVNKGDALRYNATGLINQPEGGDRFGGGTKIRTFGDWGASESIDGLPAFKSAGEEGGGYGNTMIPSIAVEKIGVLKGGRAVGYGDGTDGGVVETTIKSGRNYKNHQAMSIDASTAREGLIQAEAADSGKAWDYYLAGSFLRALYNGKPSNLDGQSVLGGVAKFGFNPTDDTRIEVLGIFDNSQPTIIRNAREEQISVRSSVVSATVEHRFSEYSSLRAGLLATDTHSVWGARARDRAVNNRIAFAEHYLKAKVADGITYHGSVGAEYKHTDYLRDRAWNANFNDVALKSKNAITFNDNLTLTGGLRYTRFDNDITYNGVKQPDTLRDDSVVSYEVGAAYSILEQTRLRTSLASGYNRFFEKYGNFGTMALNTRGAGDDIVDSRTIEVGVNQGWKGGWFDAALYNIVQKGVPRQTNGAIESVKVDQSGLELEAQFDVTSQLSVSAGYMRVLKLETTRANGAKVNGNIYWDGQSTSVPENQFSLRVSFDATDRWNLWTALYHSTGYEAVDSNGAVTERDGFSRVDIGTSYSFTPSLAVRLRVENLFNERDFGQTVKGVPANDAGKLGRVFWVGADYTF
ncbi:TonB-dependent receptor [Azospirillum sp.]|uniref:TonB-dependent receptor n=1 Tax=Azospirillum sp. TaxID=34012 RepID=UPI002D310E75|nr:TonB-dependent receptor [Azospirillum sp.]HYD64383.1 TonB-dependent receptor [Azospirillum sp.]